MINVFIGADSREPAAFHVAAHSIIRHASKPVGIIPLVQTQLRELGIYTRATDPSESTEFSLTRFLVPYLSDFRGQSIFVDCDILACADVYELLSLHDSHNAVSVVQHNYVPKTQTKMGGKKQTAYPRKNWSSVMVFQNDNFDCRKLSPAMVSNCVSAEFLQRFGWTDRIGSLPIEWNHLVGEYEPNRHAKLLHYTLGTCEFDPWFKELARIYGAER